MTGLYIYIKSNLASTREINGLSQFQHVIQHSHSLVFSANEMFVKKKILVKLEKVWPFDYHY